MPSIKTKNKRLKMKKDRESDSEGYFQVYSEYSKSLRLWFISFGIGGPVLFLSNWNNLTCLSINFFSISVWFVLGVILQILLAILNKYSSWVGYYGEFKPSYQQSKVYKLVEKLSCKIIIDIVIDILTILCYAIAIMLIANTL